MQNMMAVQVILKQIFSAGNSILSRSKIEYICSFDDIWMIRTVVLLKIDLKPNSKTLLKM